MMGIRPWAGHAGRINRRLSLALVFGAIALEAAALPPPPEYVELTPATMKQLGFEYRIHRRGDVSSITLEYPGRIRKKLRPRYMEVQARNRAGQRLQHSRARARIDETGSSVEHFFDHRQVDLSISVEYGEPYVFASTVYGIKSVSAFITNFVKPADSLPPASAGAKP